MLIILAHYMLKDLASMADHNMDMLVIYHWSNHYQKQINACFVDSDVDDDDTDDGGLVQR